MGLNIADALVAQKLRKSGGSTRKDLPPWILVKGFTGIGCGKRETRPESNVRPILRTCFNVERGGHEKETCSRSLTSSRPVWLSPSDHIVDFLFPLICHFSPCSFLGGSETIREPLKAEFKRLKNVKEENLVKSLKAEIETTHDKHRDEEKLEKQLQAWRNNPSWIDQPPKVQVKTQNGSFCHLNVEVNVGLPPETVYNIFTHPDNKRYFKNIKECISRKVLMEEGPMQTVEVKQAAAWKFLWWADYDSCSNGRGRIGSKVTMDQMFQPSAILTPPPLSWYIRGITIKTTESMIDDLLAEAARLRGGGGGGHDDDGQGENGAVLEKSKDEHIKERWRSRRRSNGMRYTNRRMM
ncbi:hypothetical protein Bca101_093061 [Brassica carinata]